MKKMFSNLLMILTIGILSHYFVSQSPAYQNVNIQDHTFVENNRPSDVEDRQKEFDIITIHNKGYDKFRMGPISFYHEKHARQYKVNCWKCHHEYIDGRVNIWSPWGTTEKCIECHDPDIKKEGVIKLQTAFHLNCKTCHQEMGIYKGKVRASQKCGTCHVQDVIIKNDFHREKKMGPVLFRHQKHVKTYLNPDGNSISCEECHHEYIEGKNIWKEGDTVKKCGTIDCHDPLEKRGEKQEKLKTAYHYACKYCHRDINKSDSKKDAPYIKCSGCHLATW